MAHYLVARAGDEVIAYGGHLADGRRGACDLVRRAARPSARGCRGSADARAHGALGAPGRPRADPRGPALSNEPARLLYGRFGFRPVGVRPRYYSDNGEDALIMTTEPLGSALRCASAWPRWPSAMDRSRARSRAVRAGPTMSVTLLAIESSCDETSVAVVDGRSAHPANVVASQVALHAATGGIVPEVAARAHLRWMVPCWRRRAQRRASTDLRDLDGIAVTQGPGLRARCSWASPWPAPSPGTRACRSCRSTISRGTSTRRGCSTRTSRSGRRPRSRSWRSWSAAGTRSWWR